MFDMTTNGFVATVNENDGNTMPRFRQELNNALSAFNKEALPIYKELETYRANNNTGSFTPYIDQLESRVSELIKRTTQRIESAYSSYLARLEEAYTIKEQKVEPNILALLDPDKVDMTQEEFSMLADQYDGNIAMRVALRSYADRKGLLYSPPIGFHEKRQLAERVRNTALGYIPDLHSYGPSEYMATMDGFLLNEANPLLE
jgi:hypothetical protein